MRQDFEKLFTHLKPIEPPAELFDKIMRRIYREQRILIIKRLAVFSVMLLGSIVAFIPVFKMAQTEFSNSGFLQFLSLIFSDFGTISAYWQSFVFALMESLPIMSVTAFLATILVFLESLKFVARDIRNIKYAR